LLTAPAQQDFMNIHEYQAKALLPNSLSAAQGRRRLYTDEAMDWPASWAARHRGEGADPCRRPRQGRFKDDPNGQGRVRVSKSIDEVGAKRRRHAGP